MIFLLCSLVDKPISSHLIKSFRLGFEITKAIRFMLNQKSDSIHPYFISKPMIRPLINFFGKKIEIFKYINL
jgi:hypothetical protein